MNPEEGATASPQPPPIPPAEDQDGAAPPPIPVATAFAPADPPVREIVPHDPWAHRRGEPRVFAFLWTMFLFAATAATFLAALSTGAATPDVMRPATRALLAITSAGIVLLWPMVRLSQRADPHPIGGTIQDLIVVLIPAQAVVWPQWLGWLGRWPLAAIAAVAALMAAWGLVAGGLLANAQVSHAEAERRANETGPVRWAASGWMAGFVVLCAGGLIAPLIARSALVGITGQPQEAVRYSWMLSPVTGVYEVLRDRSWSGVSATVFAGHWLAIAVLAAAGAILWIVACARGRSRYGDRGLH